MHYDWTEEELGFQAEVRSFLREHVTDEIRAAGNLMTSVYADHEATMRWQRILLERGWVAPALPQEYGGCGWTVRQRYLFARECASAGAPPLSPGGLQMCAPALIEFGTQEQKAFFLPRILSGEHFWCQGYSEPGSGSDLASLQMSAIADGDDLICNGAKIWTTHANIANWIFCLVRTDRSGKPQQGITFLLIDMSSPGIDVRPIISLTGEHIQNEIFFTNVRVPKLNVVGKVNEGWTVAKYLLEFERGGTAYAPMLQARLEQIRTFSANAPGDGEQPLLEEPLFAARLSSTLIRVAALEIYELQAMATYSAGGSQSTSASVMKILGTELAQEVTELALEASGNYGAGYQPQAACPGGPVFYRHAAEAHCGPIEAVLAPLRYLNERAGSIYAGSNEIQRNILAKIALKLY